MSSRHGEAPKPRGDSAAAAAENTLSSETLFRALECGARSNPKLGPAWEMVQRVVSMARTVVKGTESQRAFNVEFANMCLTCLSSVGELEDAAFEIANPGRQAWHARSDEVAAIGDAELLRALAQHVASQSTTLAPQYLEHIASAAAQKAARQSRKRERQAPGQTRGGAAPQRPSARTESRRTHGAAMLAPDDNTLGLLEESATAQAALQQLLSRNDSSITGDTAGVGGTGTQGSQAQPNALDPSVADTPGLFYSKASARTKGAMGKTYDLRNPSVRLSAIPELSKRLQPWQWPVPQYSGLAVDRVAPEKDARVPHHTHRHSGHMTGESTADGGAVATPANVSALAMLDVCAASTPQDLLQHWGARDAMLATLKACAMAQSTTALATPSTTASPQAAPPVAVAARHASPPHEGDETAGSEKVHTSEGGDKRFFVDPSTHVSSSVPKSIVAAQVHFGVWKLDFPKYTPLL